MKKLLYLLFLSFFILFSCSDDESGDINANGQITLDGSENINLDYAALEGVISSGNHYSFHLSFFDKEIDYQSRATTIPGQGVDLYFNFFSPCPESIKFGDFEYISPLELTNKTPEEGFFTVGTLTRIIGDVPEVLQINEGTVSISKKEGEGDLNLTVSFDLEFSNGKSLTGEYSGKVEMVGDAEIDEECEAGNGDGSPDQGEDPGPGGDLSLGEKTFELNSGIVVNVGSNGTHYGYSFFLSSEQAFNQDSDELKEGENYVTLHLFSAGTDAFKDGTFNLMSGIPFANQNFLGSALVVETYDPAMPQTLEATLGSVAVERVNDEFKLTLDLTLNNGTKLTGSVGGAYPVIDAPDQPVQENMFTWDGVNHDIVDLYIVDFGALEGHYEYEILLWTKTNEEIAGEDPATAVNFHLLHLFAFSWGNSSFSDGSFAVKPGVLVSNPSVNQQNFIDLGYVAEFGDDPNAEFYEKSNDFLSGTVIISEENAQTFTIEFEATLDDGEKISGHYSGGFDLVQPAPEVSRSGRIKSPKQLKRRLSVK